MEYRRGLLGIPIMLLCVYLFYLSGPPWGSSRGAAAIYSVIAFLFVTLTASFVNITHGDDTPANRVFSGIAGYASIIFAGAAIFYTLQGDILAIHTRPAGIFLNLIAFASSGFLVLCYSLLLTRKIHEESIFHSKYIGVIVTIVPTALFVVFMILARLPFPDELFLFGGYVAGVIAAFSFFGAAFIIARKRVKLVQLDSVRLIATFLFFGVASINHILILPDPSINWVFTMGLASIGLIYAVIGTVYPHLCTLGLRSRPAYLFALWISIIIVLPFLVIYFIDGLNPGFYLVDLGLSGFAHIGSAILAGSIAYILHSYSLGRPLPWRFPIIILMIYWFIAELYVAVSPLNPYYAMTESNVPYVVGAIVTTILLTIAYHNTLTPRQDLRTEPSMSEYLLMIMISVFVIGLGELVHIFGGLVVPQYLHSRIASSILFLFNFAALYALLNFSFVVITLSGNEITPDTIAGGLITIWIITGILRANFTIWTIGWWMSELLLVIAAIGSIGFVIHEYTSLSTRNQDLKKRVEIQNALLVKELLKTIQSASDKIEHMTTTDSIGVRLDIVSESISNLSRAEEMLQYINLIITDQPPQQISTRAIDVSDLIHAVIIPDLECHSPSINLPEKPCVVRANGILIDAIRYLIDVILRVGRIDSMMFEVKSFGSNDEFCMIQLITILLVENSHEKQTLLTRYTGITFHEKVEVAFARRLLSLLNGQFYFEITSIDSTRLSVKLSIILPKTLENNG